METTIPSRPHLEIFNPDHSQKTHGGFQCFSQLATEIRLIIWNHVLQRHRLLHVILEKQDERNPGNETAAAPPNPVPNALGRLASGKHYEAVVKARCSFIPELMSVNRESREAALAFYHVQLPCCLKSNTHSQEAIIRLNLDWDHLEISAEPLSFKETFIDFLHDLRAHDPKGSGLRHLVIKDNHLRTDAAGSPKPSDLNEDALAAFDTAVKELKSIWFMCTSPGGRALDVMTYIRANVFNYGVPLFPTFTFFDPPSPDPRNISRDLDNIWGGVHDPREKVLGWRLFLRNFNIQPEAAGLRPSTDVRIMIASDQESEVRTSVDATRVLHEEDFEWLRLQWWFRGWDMPRSGGGGDRPAGCFTTASGLQPSLPQFDGPDILAAAPRPALGFWLFPVEAFGEILENEPPQTWMKTKGIFNLSSSWPELALAQI